MTSAAKLSTSCPGPSRPYVLLTGATGLLGRYLLRDLLLAGKRVAVIARPSGKLSARDRIESIMQDWEIETDRALPRPMVLQGELCEEGLGLSDQDKRWAGENCGTILHNAAVLRFQACSASDEPFRTNLGGTFNVLEFARESGIRQLHYVSTAYVCGESEKAVLESELDREQDHRNDYERSKFQAEQLVRQATGFDNITVYRPAVIIGDSVTGYTSTYHGLFTYLRLIAMLVPHQKTNDDGVHETPIRLPMNGDEPRNLVPVDWVSAAITHVMETPAAHGLTFHLTPETGATAKQVIETCCRYFNSAGVIFAGPDADADNSSDFTRAIFDNTRVYESYHTSDPSFDRSNIKQWAGHLPCPEVNESMIYRFIEFGEQNRWGKQRPSVPEVQYWFEDHLEEIAALAESIVARLSVHTMTPVSVGLDIRGEGGGQWTLVGLGESVEIRRGLPVDNSPLLTIDGKHVSRILDQFNSKDPDAVLGLFADQFESTISLALR